MRLGFRTISFLVLLRAACVGAVKPHHLTVDLAAAQGELRALHGINKGTISANGLKHTSVCTYPRPSCTIASHFPALRSDLMALFGSLPQKANS